MTYWSGEKLVKNNAVVSDFSKDNVDVNAYNLRMGDCYFRTGEGSEAAKQTKKQLGAGEAFLIPPGQFAYLLSLETINVPSNAMAFISMRTGIKFKGLINVSGFHVDPGYSGKLVYAVFNASPSPVHICQGDPIFKIWFADISQTSTEKYLYSGRGQNDISNDLISGMSKEIYSLQSIAEQIRNVKSELDLELGKQKPTIDNLTFVWRTIVLGVVGFFILSVLALSWPTLLLGGTWVKDKLSQQSTVNSMP